MKRAIVSAALLVLAEAAVVHAQPPASLPEAASLPKPAIVTDTGAPQTHVSSCNFVPTTAVGLSEQWWAKVDYLHWWMKSYSVPPLVTTAEAGTGFGQAGILGEPTTRLLFGDEDVELDGQHGFRVRGGKWLTADQSGGIQASYFRLDDESTFFSAASNAVGAPILARPYVSAFFDDEQAFLIAFPGPPQAALAGGITINGRMEFYGADVLAMIDVSPWTWGRTHFTVGARYLDLDEDLRIESASTALIGGVIGFRGDPVSAPDRIVIRDTFNTSNHFLGAQLGLQSTYASGPFSLEAGVRIGFGSTTQIVEIAGSTTRIRAAGGVDSTQGGLLALPSNSVRQTEDDFAIVPEVTLQLQYEVSGNLSLHLGYDFLYWNAVVRPGEQINRVINVTQVPASLAFTPGFGPERPEVVFHKTQFWAQGLNAGLTLRY